jgi:hypothetical protein
MVGKLDFSYYILTPADQLATAIIDYTKYYRDASRGRTCIHTLYSSLTTAGIDVSNYQIVAEFTTDGPDGVGAIAMGEADATFQDTRKVVVSLTSPRPLLHAATLKKITIHLTSDPINPRLLRIYRIPKPPLRGTNPTTQAYLPHPSTPPPRRSPSYLGHSYNVGL